MPENPTNPPEGMPAHESAVPGPPAAPGAPDSPQPQHEQKAGQIGDSAGWVVERPDVTLPWAWSAPGMPPPPPVASAQPSPARPWIIALVIVSVLSLLVGGAATAVGGLALMLATEDGGFGANFDDPSSTFGESALYGEYIGSSEFSGVRSDDGLNRGACFTVEGLDEEFVGKVALRSCADPHDNEAYAIKTIPGDEFPGYDDIGDRVYDTCEGAFAGYVGADYEDSAADFGGLAPTEKGWAQGQRDIVCFAFLYDDERTGSLHSSGL